MKTDDAQEAQEFPIATEHLMKGSRVTADEIERAWPDAKRGTDAYRFKMLQPGLAWQGAEWHGGVGRGGARFGAAGTGTARHGWARPGVAGHGL